MEQRSITLEGIYKRLVLLENALRVKGIIDQKQEDFEDEGELTDEFKAQIEQARRTPLSGYISHEEVKKRLFSKRK